MVSQFRQFNHPPAKGCPLHRHPRIDPATAIKPPRPGMVKVLTPKSNSPAFSIRGFLPSAGGGSRSAPGMFFGTWRIGGVNTAPSPPHAIRSTPGPLRSAAPLTCPPGLPLGQGPGRLGTRASPAGVSASPGGASARTDNAQLPFSNAFTDAVTAGCVRCTASAAREYPRPACHRQTPASVWFPATMV